MTPWYIYRSGTIYNHSSFRTETILILKLLYICSLKGSMGQQCSISFESGPDTTKNVVYHEREDTSDNVH